MNGKLRRLAAALAVAALSTAAGAGCVTTKIDAARGDIAAEPVEHDHAVLPLTASVAKFTDVSGRRLPKETLDAWTKSYVAVLRNSKVFLDVLPPPRSGAAGPADLRIRGRVVESLVRRNYSWISSWVAVGIVTFGYGTPVLPILGVPYASDSVDLALEVRVEAADGRPIAHYRSRFRDGLYLNIYSDDTLTGYADEPRKALQVVIGRSVERLIEDYPRFAALGGSRPPQAVSAPVRPDYAEPPAPPVAATPPRRRDPPLRPVVEAPEPPAPRPAHAAPLHVGAIERVDSRWGLLVVSLAPGAEVMTNDILEVTRGATRVGKVRVAKVMDGAGTFSAAPDRGQPIDAFRISDRVMLPRE